MKPGKVNYQNSWTFGIRHFDAGLHVETLKAANVILRSTGGCL
jgi:hypothetical protein